MLAIFRPLIIPDFILAENVLMFNFNAKIERNYWDLKSISPC
jgi:hypothetical protein